MHAHTNAHARIHINAHARTHINAHARAHINAHARTHTNEHAHAHTKYLHTNIRSFLMHTSPPDKTFCSSVITVEI